MIGQADVIAFLRTPEAFGGDAPASDCQTIVTHISTVLLIGCRAIKLKHPERLPYLDFGTPELRLSACLEELRLNRRTAPGIYRAVHRVTRAPDGGLELNGDGALVDAVVEMERFDESRLFDRLVRERRLTIADVEALADVIAKFHASIGPVAGEGAQRLERVLAGNETSLEACNVFTPAEVTDLTGRCRTEFEKVRFLLDSRSRAGFVRRGHGDLHLRNICMIEGKPILFDCLEFDEELATTDVLYDLAFVLMDLWRRNLKLHANVLLNRYLDATGDEAGIRLMPLFMAVRAVIRAHVVAREVASTELGMAWNRAEARAYASMSREMLREIPATLVAIGGYSGAGKSSVAMRIAPETGRVPGARVLSSDRIRKQLFRVPATTRLNGQAYADSVSATVYETMRACARGTLRAGHSVVAEAVFNRTSERAALAELAADAAVPFRPLWLEAPADILMRRVADRQGDVSDATPAVVMEQVARRGEPRDWPRLCAVGDLDSICAAAKTLTNSPVLPLPARPCAKMRVPRIGAGPFVCARSAAVGKAVCDPEPLSRTAAGHVARPFERAATGTTAAAIIPLVTDRSARLERSKT
jgi:aminoglycoside phosphotransferase family enzyme/predicted kinase